MRVIGLTGGIASGKSTVSSILRSLGAIIINADEIARLIVEPGKPAWRDIVSTFGREVLNQDDTINRRLLGNKVFGNRDMLAKLNRITHPRIIESCRRRLKEIAETIPDATVVLEVPLLFEVGMDKMVDEVWVVWTSEEVELERLMERDNLSRDQALQRIRAQMPLAEKTRRADRVIDNTGRLEETRNQITKFFNEITKQLEDKIY